MTVAGTSPPAPTRRRSRARPLVLGALVLGAGGWLFAQWWHGRTWAETDNAQVDGHIVPVLAKVGGYVRTVAGEENATVARGAVVVTIDDAEYRARLAQAEAEYAAAASALGDRAGGGIGQAEAQVQTAWNQRAASDANIAAARATYERAAADLRRLQQLAEKQIISGQALDAAAASAATLKAQLDALERQAGAAGATLTGAQAGVRLAAARLAAARAARDNASLQLSYATVRAPLDGVLARKQVEPGQLVQPGAPLFVVVADSGGWVTANFKETQLDRLRIGQEARLEVDAYPGCVARGVVESVSPATGAKFALLPPDNATGNFTKVVQRIPVRVHVAAGCGPGRPLRPGMSVTAAVRTR